MTRRRWFLHYIRCALDQRKGRVAVASFSVMIAAAIFVSALGLSLGIREKLGGELKAYGANVMILPVEGFLSGDILSELTEDLGVEAYSGQIYSRVKINGADVELIGLDIEWLRKHGWKIDGRWPEKGEIIVGATLRDALKLRTGDLVTLVFDSKKVEVPVAGFVERGGSEDRAVLMELAESQAYLGLEGKLSSVLVRVMPGSIDDAVKKVSDKIRGAEVKTLRQVAFAEENFLRKIELLMFLVTLVVVVTSSISVSSTMSATVLERIKEIGLMMAIGGTRRRIRRFYLFESAVIGMAGGLLGYIIGFVAAQAVSKGAFGSFVNVPLYLLIVSVLLGVLLAVSSSLLPLSDALRNKPSYILRGQ